MTPDEARKNCTCEPGERVLNGHREGLALEGWMEEQAEGGEE